MPPNSRTRTSPLPQAEVLRHYRPKAHLAVVPHVHDLHRLNGPAPPTCKGRSGALFVGNMNHLPNQ